MWQQALIALVVVIATAYVAWTVVSPRLRLRLIDLMIRSGLAAGWAARQRAKLSAGGCGNCSAGVHSAAGRRTPARH